MTRKPKTSDDDEGTDDDRLWSLKFNLRAVDEERSERTGLPNINVFVQVPMLVTESGFARIKCMSQRFVIDKYVFRIYACEVCRSGEYGPNSRAE